jgi:N-methylhydantoinase B
MIDEGLPIHLANIHLVPQITREYFDEIQPGDCFLTNSPYFGNTHHADYTLHSPVFCDGEPLFWTVSRAHQADVGAPVPSTYVADGETVFEEGMHFPSIRIQQEYDDREDIVRMCTENIRVGETQWYGDYRAQVASVRQGEKEIQELCDEYGVEVVKKFAEEWLNYGERMMRQEIATLPEKTISHTARHDPIPDAAPDGVPVNVELSIRPEEERIVVDLTDNMDTIPAGFNLTEATTVAAVYGGIFNNLDTDIPHNQGCIDRIEIKMGDGKIVGRPDYPTGTSLATTNVCDTLFNAVQASFGQLGEPYGMAEGASGMPIVVSNISGTDPRRDEEFVNQVIYYGGGGPAVHGHDGWMMYGIPITGGVIYRDSVEVDERQYPILVEENELIPDTGGPGKWRGAPGCICRYRPRDTEITVTYFGNSTEYPPKGICGAEAGGKAATKIENVDGTVVDTPPINVIEVEPGETVIGKFAGGGGYGNPFERDPERVRSDVEQGYVTVEGAKKDYGVVLEETSAGVEINKDATQERRDEVDQ